MRRNLLNYAGGSVSSTTSQISSAFIWRRVHSLMGFWLVLFLIVHLVTNSQAALWIGDDGSGFIRLVNFLEALPYLEAIETVLIGIPLLIHMVWGVQRLLSARPNVIASQGNVPVLKYERNWAYTFQRLSSWILALGLIGHLVQMKWLEAPRKVSGNFGNHYLTRISFDDGLYTLAARLHAALLTPSDIAEVKRQLEQLRSISSESIAHQTSDHEPEAMMRDQMQQVIQEREWLEALASFHLKQDQLISVSSAPGTGFLLLVRDTFKSPVMAILYTIFVLAAAFHAFNGLWTFLITWGVILSFRSQKATLPLAFIGMVFLTFLGLAAIWCTYWINLRS